MKYLSVWLWLGLIWLAGNASDRIWLILDHREPGWDQSNHLTGSLNYLQALQKAEIFNPSWWTELWRLSAKYPPLTYISSAPFQELLGKGNDEALGLNFLSSGILIIAVYYLGKTLFNQRVGLIAAAFCIVLPRLYFEKLVYLTDNLLVAVITACFTFLTLWRNEKKLSKQWLYSSIFGICWGLGLLTKQSIMFFLLIPLIWVTCRFLFMRQYLRILQLFTSFLISALIWVPWYRTNWIYAFGTYNSSVTLPAAAEGDPAINTLAAWLYYWQDLPIAVSWVLLIVPLVGIILNIAGRFGRTETRPIRDSLVWLAVYWFGGYLINNLNINKDGRYIIPYLPILAVFLAYGLTQWRGKWQKIQVWTIALAFIVMLGKIYPIPGVTQLAQLLSLGGTDYPYTGQAWPNTEVIKTITKTTPYLQATLGVIPNTSQINHNNLNYHGALADFQVYGRELGSKTEEVEQDGNSFDWFLSKTGDNTFTKKPQLAFGEALEKDSNFNLLKSWILPDQTTLKLYHRLNSLVTVTTTPQKQEKIELKEVLVPSIFPSEVPIPVTYHWSGLGEDLKNGFVLINWQKENTKTGWIHDHRIGMGELYQTGTQTLEVTEKTAMLTSQEPGSYTLQVTYINPQTGISYPVKVPPVTVEIGAAPPLETPILDRVTQLRNLALFLPKGIKGLDPIFLQVARLNQYDPKQDYLEQTAQTLSYRLQKEETLTTPQRINYLYGVLLARVLQQDPIKAIPILEQLIQLEPKNPYLHAYLAFVHLYNWDSASAEIAFQPLQGNQEREIRILQGIIAILRGHIGEGISLIKAAPN